MSNSVLLKNKNRFEFFRYVAGFLVVLLIIQYFYPLIPFLPTGRKEANGDISSAKDSDDALFINVNPDFKVEFGNKDELTDHRVRFESVASEDNPFISQKNKEILENDATFVSKLAKAISQEAKEIIPTNIFSLNQTGIEFSLKEAKVAEPEKVINDKPEEVSENQADLSTSESVASSSPEKISSGVRELLENFKFKIKNLAIPVYAQEINRSELNVLLDNENNEEQEELEESEKTFENNPEKELEKEKSILENLKTELRNMVLEEEAKLGRPLQSGDELYEMITKAKSVYSQTELAEKEGKKIVRNPEVVPGVDVEYEVLEGKGIKEEIILKEKRQFTRECVSEIINQKESELTGECSLPQNTFVFDLVLDKGVKINQAIGGVNKSPGGTYFFTDEKDNYLFHFLPLFAVDKRGAKTNAVTLQIKKSNGENQEEKLENNSQGYEMVISVDFSWLMDPEREYPIRIDPSIIHDLEAEFDSGSALNRVESISGPKVQLENQSAGNDQYTKLLIHADGSNGSLAFSDYSMGEADKKTVSYYDDAKISTVQSEFGGSSAYFDGSGDYIWSPDNDDWNLDSDDFTIDFWAYHTEAIGGNDAYFTYGNTTAGTATNLGWYLRRDTSGKLQILLSSDGTSWDFNGTSDEVISSNAWHHIALIRDKNTIKAFLDGIAMTLSATSYTNAISTSGDRLTIAAERYNNSGTPAYLNYFGGYLDEIRISKGVARWKSNFNLPTDAYDTVKEYGQYTSQVLDLSNLSPDINYLRWTENGVQTGDGETLKDTTSLVAQWNFNEISGTTVANGAGASSCGGTPTNCNLTLNNFSSTGSQDEAVGSGWTANNKRWGAGALMISSVATADSLSQSDVAANILDPNSLDFSIETWIKTNDTSAEIMSNNNNNGTACTNNGYYLGIDSNGYPIFKLDTNGGTAGCEGDITGNVLVNDGFYHHLGIIVTRGVGAYIYMDGRLIGSDISLSSYSSLIVSGSFYLGGSSGGLDAVLDSTRFYNRSLSAEEILSNYQAGNIEIQTRTGADSTPNDGDWEEWKPTSASETALDNLDSNEDNTKVYDWAVSNSNINQNWYKLNNSIPATCDSGSPCPYGDGRMGLGTTSADQNNAYASTVIKDGNVYKMWYTGSGGSGNRIYYATSSDGLTWTKYDNTLPSASDTTGTNGRIPIGTSGKGDDGAVAAAAVIKDGSTYKMWYSGFEGTDWKGIYYATSPDGLTWTKYDNTLPSASDTTGTNGRIPLGTAGKGDDYEVSSPMVIKDGSTYKMWYTGNDGTYFRIYYATSSDGLTWTKYDNTIPSASNTTGTNGRIPLGVSGTGDDYSLGQAMVIKDGGVYKMWYGGAEDSSDYRKIYYAISLDGLTWIKQDNSSPTASNISGTNGRVPLGTAGTGDLYYAGIPKIIKDGDLYKMWYAGDSTTTNNRTYYATMAGLPLAEDDSSVLKVEGTGALKISQGISQDDAATVGLWHLEETSGTGAYKKDSSGRGNDGTPNGATTAIGKSGNGVNALGSTDRVTIADDASLDFAAASNFTIELWEQFNAVALANDRYMIAKWDGTTGGYKIYMDASGNICFSIDDDSTWSPDDSACSSGVRYDDYSWHHIAAKKTGTSRIDLYIDGNLSASDTSIAATNTLANSGSFYIGVDDEDTSVSDGWKGNLDEVRVSKVSRTDEEIAESYRSGRDHRVSRIITSADLSSKSKMPFYIAADRSGTYLEATVGESAYVNYEPDVNTVGLWHLDEQNGSGAYIKDSSIYGNHGTPTGTTYVEGKMGRARYNDGADDNISIGDNASLDFAAADNFTVEAWVRHNGSISTNNDFIITKADTTTGGYKIYMDPTGDLCFAIDDDASWTPDDSACTSGVDYDDGNWHYVSGVKTGTTKIELYVDGNLVASDVSISATNTLANGNNLYIGVDRDGTSNEWDGYIDEVRVSNVARSVDEINQVYMVKQRTHPITIDFSSKLSVSNLIADSNDISFSLKTNDGLLFNSYNPPRLYQGEKIIVKENVDGTEYIAQGTVVSVGVSGAVTVSSWEGSSTFPASGYSADATVFKWQREYWDLTGVMDSQIDASVKMTLRVTDGLEGRNIWLDDLKSADSYLTNSTATCNVTSTNGRYLQYRVLFSTTDHQVTPYLSSVNTNYSLTPTTDRLMRHGKWFAPNGTKQPFWWGGAVADQCP